MSVCSPSWRGRKRTGSPLLSDSNGMSTTRPSSDTPSSSFTTAFAYVADITDADRRAAGFGVIGAAIAFGFIVGPALGGVLGSVDLRLPFTVPNLPNLVGINLYFQVLGGDPGAPNGISMTNGLHEVIGS